MGVRLPFAPQVLPPIQSSSALVATGNLLDEIDNRSRRERFRNVAEGLPEDPRISSAEVAAEFLLKANERVTFSFRFVLPKGVDAMKVLASARIPPTQWTFGNQAWRDDHGRSISW